MSIREFISQVKRGMAHTNRYLVNIPFSESGSAKLASILCESVQLPGLSIATTPQRVMGEARELPYERIYNTVNMTFFVDADMKVKLLFDQWMNSIIDPVSKTIGYYSDYTRAIEIDVYDKTEKRRPYTVILNEAYPKTVNEIILANDSREVMKMMVTFQYKFHHVLQAQSDKKPILSSSSGSVYAIGDARQDLQGIGTGAGSSDYELYGYT